MYIAAAGVCCMQPTVTLGVGMHTQTDGIHFPCAGILRTTRIMTYSNDTMSVRVCVRVVVIRIIITDIGCMIYVLQ